MKFLYISGRKDIYSRHELGFVATLRKLGEVEVVRLGHKRSYVDTIDILSDGAYTRVRVINIESDSSVVNTLIKRKISKYMDLITNAVDISAYDYVIASPRLPILLASALYNKLNIPIFLRLWSIRAFKVPDYIKYGVWHDILNIVPSLSANLIYIIKANKIIFLDNFTYKLARRIYKLFSGKFYKIYPPCGYVVNNSYKNYTVPEKIRDIDEYILGVTVLNKSGPYLKLEALPHAYIFYHVAKKNPKIPVVVVGSSRDEFILKVLKGRKELLPKNLIILGKGFQDLLLKQIYINAKLVIHFNPFSSISNRFIEALCLGKAIITDKNLLRLYPELSEYKAVKIVNNFYEYSQIINKLYKNNNEIEKLSINAKRAYNELFSTHVNLTHFRNLLKKYNY